MDLSSGQFIYDKTDLILPDTIPIMLKRTYTSNDSTSRSFGIGAMQYYDMFISGDDVGYTYVELMLPDGSRLYFYRTSSGGGSGTGYQNAIFANTSGPPEWYGATISSADIASDQAVFPGGYWILTKKDHTNYYFPEGFQQTNPGLMALIGIRDRNGNTLTITRDSNGNITKITSPNGRYINFTSDTSNRITQAQDNIGRTVAYTYDTGGHLLTVTDANSGVTTFTYDANDNMLTVEDALSITYLTNQYDANKRVQKQTLADGNTYQYSWTAGSSSQLTYAHTFTSGFSSAGGSASLVQAFRLCTGCSEGYESLVSKVDVTDPRGIVREVQFGSTGQVSSDTSAEGVTGQQTTSYTYFSDNLLESTEDALSRTTTYSYDANGNTTEITRLSGTASAATTFFTFDPTFNQLSSTTDPLGNTTTFSHDSRGNLTAIADALGHTTTFASDAQGRQSSVTDAVGNKTQYQYASGDLASITDPLGRTTIQIHDGAGRLTSVVNPLGQTTTYTYDNLNDPLTVKDTLGNQTSFSYDGNGNMTGVTDAKSHGTSYTYDNMDRLETREDPLSRSEGYQYDENGNLKQFTDRRGKVTVYTYDNLNRRTFAGFNKTAGPTYDSTISYTYDAGNRLTQAVDSIAGTITRSYDDLDRVTSEAGPQGTLSYTFDPANRRSSMTANNQNPVYYYYDDADRLLQIAQGTSIVSFAYDAANHRTALTLPNGIMMAYSYDSASELTAIKYSVGMNTLGDLNYSYDLAGRRTNVGGSYATVQLPAAVSTTAYDAANELTTWGTATPTYDSNGNAVSDGVNSYVWDARNQLSSMNSGADSFQYDAFGRRVGKTIVGSATSYLYDGPNPVQELSGTTVSANLLGGFGMDERFTRTDSSGTANFLTDALGSTLELSDNRGASFARYSYEPFGNAVTTASASNPYQYTGRENDVAGVYYYRNRYYNPLSGRFISEDPLGLYGGLNLYRYVSDSPTNRKDPLGLYEGVDDATAIIGGAILGIGGQAVNDIMSGELSSPGSYINAAIGGAVAGEVTLYFGAAIGGAAGNFVNNLANQEMKMISGDQGPSFDPQQLGQAAVAGGVLGAVIPEGSAASEGVLGELQKGTAATFGAGAAGATCRYYFRMSGRKDDCAF